MFENEKYFSISFCFFIRMRFIISALHFYMNFPEESKMECNFIERVLCAEHLAIRAIETIL